jgi:hypothetical protein
MLVHPAGQLGQPDVGAQVRAEGGVDPDQAPVEDGGLAAEEAGAGRRLGPVLGRARDRAEVDGPVLRVAARTERGA